MHGHVPCCGGRTRTELSTTTTTPSAANMTVSTTTADKNSTVVVQATSTKKKKKKKDEATIRAVIFDLDGTLLDTESLSCRAVIESFATIGLAIPEDILATLHDGGMLLPWELKRLTLGLRGSGMFV